MSMDCSTRIPSPQNSGRWLPSKLSKIDRVHLRIPVVTADAVTNQMRLLSTVSPSSVISVRSSNDMRILQEVNPLTLSIFDLHSTSIFDTRSFSFEEV